MTSGSVWETRRKDPGKNLYENVITDRHLVVLTTFHLTYGPEHPTLSLQPPWNQTYTSSYLVSSGMA